MYNVKCMATTDDMKRNKILKFYLKRNKQTEKTLKYGNNTKNVKVIMEWQISCVIFNLHA